MQNKETKWEERLSKFIPEDADLLSEISTKRVFCSRDALVRLISQEIEKAYQKGKKDKQFLYTAKEGSIVLIDKEMQEYTENIRLQTLEELEKVIKEKASIKTEDKVVDIAILLFSEDILQQINKMKTNEKTN